MVSSVSAPTTNILFFSSTPNYNRSTHVSAKRLKIISPQALCDEELKGTCQNEKEIEMTRSDAIYMVKTGTGFVGVMSMFYVSMVLVFVI